VCVSVCVFSYTYIYLLSTAYLYVYIRVCYPYPSASLRAGMQKPQAGFTKRFSYHRGLVSREQKPLDGFTKIRDAQASILRLVYEI
jgi:hypothetical protein